MENKYRISKLFFNNYKLFEEKEIDFEKADLVVLDGPNGYGKTSIFEAIEFLITGDIKRAKECPEISGKVGYTTHFLAKEPEKEVMITGELRSDDDVLKIERKIDTQNISGLQNNPKNLKSVTMTKIWHNQKEVYHGDADGADSIIKELFGGDLLTYYDSFYYISQEDRLSFLMHSETGRMDQIKSLFNIEKEQKEYDRINTVKSKLSSKIKNSKKDYKEQEQKYNDYKKRIAEKEVGNIQYKDIFETSEKKPYWNEKIVKITEKEKLDEILIELENTAILSRNKEQFKMDLANAQFKEYISNTESLKKLLIFHVLNENLEQEKETFEKYKKIESLPIREESNEPDLEKIEYEELKKSLGLTVEIDTILHLQQEIVKARKNQTTYSDSLEKLQHSRENLTNMLLQWRENGETNIGETICPYCGTDFEIQEKYVEAVSEAKKTLEACNDIETTKIKEYFISLKKEYDEKFAQEIIEFKKRNSYMSNSMIKELMQDVSVIMPDYIKFMNFLNAQNITLEQYLLPLKDEEAWGKIIQKFVDDTNNEYIQSLPDEYLIMRKGNDFWKIYQSVYGGDIKNIAYISDADKKAKKLYLEEQYQLQEHEKLTQMESDLKKIKEDIDKLEEMESETKAVLAVYKKQIEQYQKKVIGEIQIPLYIYSGRVLQYYQGGLGIFVNYEKKDERLNTIRMVSSKKLDHDVLYTMSSGQLTGVIIAFTLTLNRIYGEDQFASILIDDPVQTMDDLNIASLVELLRNEFKEYQLIVSTHEDDFSRFIRYKYEMCHLKIKRYQLNK